MSEQVVVRGGMGLFGWLTVLFVGLKLTHFIDWSWWWVLAPTLIPVGLLLAFALVCLVLWLIVQVLK